MRNRRSGQGLVEFALILPVLLVVLFLAVDLGRVFYAVVSLHNAARVGATYAATHPYGWDASGDSAVQAEYVNVIEREWAGIDCATAVPLQPKPLDTGSDGLAVGSRLETSLQCDFRPLTPLVSNFFSGGIVKVAASAVFPIRFGVSGTNPPLPPCFGQATVPTVQKDDDPATFASKISAANLTPEASGTLTTGPKNKVQSTNPPQGSCQPFYTTVTYFYKP